MSLVPAKCPECGGNINVDGDKRLAICEFCKQPFVIEEAINNFNTTYKITNNNEIKADVVNVYENREKDFIVKAGKLIEYVGESANVIIPDSVRIIGFRAFFGCSILEVTMSRSVTKIEDNAFEGCTELKTVTIEADMIDASRDIFKGCRSLKSIKHKDKFFCNVESWENYKKSNYSEATWCFAIKQSDQGTVTIPRGVKKVVNNEFIRGYGSAAGNHCVDEIIIPDTVEEIGDYAFYYQNIKKMIIPNGVKIVNLSAFTDCHYLEEIVMPESVIKIEGKIVGCNSLKCIENYSDIKIRQPHPDVKVITKETENKVMEIKSMEEELEHMKVASLNNLCWECNRKLSLFKECKTRGCKNRGKNLTAEMLLFRNRILEKKDNLYKG